MIIQNDHDLGSTFDTNIVTPLFRVFLDSCYQTPLDLLIYCNN